MKSVSLVVRLWWEPGWGVRVAVRPANGGPPVYLNDLQELNALLEKHANTLAVHVSNEIELSAIDT